MRWIAALLMDRRRLLVLFAVVEVFLALAIPFLLIRGYHTLLDSRAGTLIEEPSRSDPGWAAVVDPTRVVGVAEVDRGVVTGVTLLVHNPAAASVGGAILAPGTLEIDGVTLAERAPTDAVVALSTAIRLGVGRVEVLDAEGWSSFLGDTRYRLDNPDPVPVDSGVAGEPDVAGDSGAAGKPGVAGDSGIAGDSGVAGERGEVDVVEVLLPVGEVEVGAEVAGAFVGRPAAGAVPVSVLPRRRLFWAAVLAEPPETASALAADLAALDHRESTVHDLPVTQLEPVALLDPGATELLIRDVVAYPVGAGAGDRLRVRIVDRTGAADLEGIAAAVAGQGIEVTEIANAAVFDGGETQIIVPIGLTGDGGALPPEVSQLSVSVGVDGVTIDGEPIEDQVVTVVVGADFDPLGL